MLLTRSHSCLGQWCQAKPGALYWGEWQDEFWWINQSIQQSINPTIHPTIHPFCLLKDGVNWMEGLDGTWAKQQCGPKNPQVDQDICSHQHHVLQTESTQKLWSDEKQPFRGSPGAKKGKGHRCLSPGRDPVSSQHQFYGTVRPGWLLWRPLHDCWSRSSLFPFHGMEPQQQSLKGNTMVTMATLLNV